MGADKRLHESRRGATKVKNAGAFAALSVNRMTTVRGRAGHAEIEISRLAELDTRGWRAYGFAKVESKIGICGKEL
jgi:hypothetical protein